MDYYRYDGKALFVCAVHTLTSFITKSHAYTLTHTKVHTCMCMCVNCKVGKPEEEKGIHVYKIHIKAHTHINNFRSDVIVVGGTAVSSVYFATLQQVRRRRSEFIALVLTRDDKSDVSVCFKLVLCAFFVR